MTRRDIFKLYYYKTTKRDLWDMVLYALAEQQGLSWEQVNVRFRRFVKTKADMKKKEKEAKT